MPTEEEWAAAMAITRWPANTSEEYKSARNALLKEEWALIDQIERVAAMRRALPQSAIMQSYTFTEGPFNLSVDEPVKETTLKELAAYGRSVITYHMMFDPTEEEPCPQCSLGIDNYNSVGKHLAQNINFVVIAKAPLPALRAWALKRGWNNLRFLSSFESTFNKDLNLERPNYAPDVKQLPGVSVFKKDDSGEVRHFYTGLPHFNAVTIRGVDLLGCLYNILDLTPEGRGDFEAGNDYI